MNPGRIRAARPAGPGVLAVAIVLLLLLPPGGSSPTRGPPSAPRAAPTGSSRPIPAHVLPGASPSGPLLDVGGWINRTGTLTTAPPARWGAMMAYDVADGCLVLFGGTGNGRQVLRDTWTYVDGVWHNITNLAGTAPSARTDGTMAYDAADSEIVLYGGIHLGTYQSDTWTFKGGQWALDGTNTSAGGPVADAMMSFDAAAQRLLLFGGSPHPGSAVRNTTFSFVHGAWTNITASVGTPPPGMTRGSMTWDGRLNATVLFGGVGPKLTYNQTWEFSLGKWRELSVPGARAPTARESAGFAYDAVDGYDVLFGGLDGAVSLNDTWAFAGGNWTQLPEPIAPAIRNLAAVAYTPGPTPLNATVVLFGGRSSALPSATNFSDTWTYKLPVQAAVTLSVPTIDVRLTLTVGIVVAGGYPPYAVNWTDLPAGCAGPTTVRSFACVPQFVGAVTVGALVNDSAGQATNATPLNLTIEPFPTVTVSATNTTGAAPLLVQFKSVRTGGTGPFTSSWNFGNGIGNASTPANPSRTYTSQGEYTVVLTVTDADGAVASSSPILVNVTAPLVVQAQASATYGWTPLVVTFTSQVIGGLGPYSYGWNLGLGGTLSTQPYARYNYTVPGVYPITLTVEDDLNHFANSTLTVTVVAPLTAGFSASNPGGPTCVGDLPRTPLLLAALPGGGSGPYNETWSINGTRYYGNTPSSLTFPGGATVPVNLTVTDARGNRSSSAHDELIPTTLCGTVPPPSAGVPTSTLELYTVLVIAVLLVIAIELGILLRGRRGRSGND